MFLSLFKKQSNTSDAPPSAWYRNAVVYQIYPRSFQDSNGDGVGDLRGIIKRLPYLESLGIGAVWISPIYTSPMKDFGYDISDFYNIDPLFGTLADFDELVVEMHKRGIKIIMDLVINHTSSEHPWFKESCSSLENPKRDWYIWQDPQKDGSPPNNWLSVSGGSAWTFDEKTNQYYLHHFLKEQPDLNWRNTDVKDEIRRIAEFWIARGVDGFRVDAMSHLVEDGLFRDDPKNTEFILNKNNQYNKYIHTFSTNRPQLENVIKFLCESINSYPNKFIVFETYLPLADTLAIYNMHPDEHHAPFNFNFFNLEWGAKTYKDFVDNFNNALSLKQIPTYVFGNHDQPRLASRFGEGQARLCAMLLLTLRGLPFIYYGEEIGMKNVDIPKEKIKDGFAHDSVNIGLSRDPARTPMQWDNSSYAGFSTNEPWLPISPEYEKINVSAETSDPKSMFNLYCSLIGYRNKSDILKHGSYKSINTNNNDVFGYIRSYKKKEILILLNFSNTSQIISIKEGGIVIFSTHLDTPPNTPVANTIEMRPFEGYVIELQ